MDLVVQRMEAKPGFFSLFLALAGYAIESVDSSGRLNSTAHSFPDYRIFRGEL
jgi:hypothetical protein